MERLQDPEFLVEFFERRKTNLHYFRKSVTDAVMRTYKEAALILNELYVWSQNANFGITPDLEELFRPLHREAGYLYPGFYTDYQVKGHPDEAPWIRIYAVRCDENLYVITGIGIKVVARIQDDQLLVEELKKLEMATDFLKSQGML